jgi:anti-sigma B factor antagonist
MNMNRNEQEGLQIISITGRLDTGTAQQMEDYLNQLIADGQNRILLNMQDLDSISSAGLRVLLSAVKKANRQSGILALCNLNESVYDVFEISGFSEIFSIYMNVDQALIQINP